jgi:hypothetical protein
VRRMAASFQAAGALTFHAIPDFPSGLSLRMAQLLLVPAWELIFFARLRQSFSSLDRCERPNATDCT